MFKIGFRSQAFENELEIAKELGMEVIELVVLKNQCARRKEMKINLERYDIKATAISLDDRDNLEELITEIDFAASIQSKILVGHLHPVTWNDREGIEEFKKVWGPACKYAEDKGVKLAIQSCLLNPESWEIMLNEIPELGFKYDPSFSLKAGRNIRSEIIKFGSHICHIHAKDEMMIERTTDFGSGIIQFRYAPAGMGDIHWGSVIALLYEAGYQGDIAIEPHSEFWCSIDNGNLKKGLILAKRHLESFIV